MDTKGALDTSARHLSGARFSLPDPKLAPGTATSGKNPNTKTNAKFKRVLQKNF